MDGGDRGPQPRDRLLARRLVGQHQGRVPRASGTPRRRTGGAGADRLTGSRAPFLVLAGIAAVAACFALGALTQIYTGEDARYNLAWGQDLFHLEQPDFDGPAPAKHPLYLAIGVLLAPLGGSATLFVFEAFAVATFVLLGYGAYRFAAAIAGPVAGWVAVVVVLTRPEAIEQLVNTNKDILFVALALLAGALAIEHRTRRPVPVLALLALAGLIRPEAWALAGAYWLWLAIRSREEARRGPIVALLLAAPVIWVGTDLLLTGDALHTLHHAQDKPDEIRAAGFADRSGGGGGSTSRLDRLGNGLENGLPGTIGWGALLAGLAIIGGQLYSGIRAGRGREAAGVLAVPVALIAAAVGTAVVIVAVGLSLPGRFLLLAALTLVCVGAASARGLGRSRLAEVAFALLAIGTLVTLPAAVDDWHRDADQRERTREQADELLALANEPAVNRALERCPPIAFGGRNRARVSLGRGVVALELDVGVGDLELGREVLLEPGGSAFAWGLAPGNPSFGPDLPRKERATTAATNGHWTFASRC